MITLRRAEQKDWARLYHWRNDPRTRDSLISTEPVQLADHLKWLDQILKSETTDLFVGHDTFGPVVGTCRLDLVKAKKATRVECSVTVDPVQRGKGYAQPLIEALVQEYLKKYGAWPFVAVVKADNYASLRAFAASGFKVMEPTAGDGLVSLMFFADTE